MHTSVILSLFWAKLKLRIKLTGTLHSQYKRRLRQLQQADRDNDPSRTSRQYRALSLSDRLLLHVVVVTDWRWSAVLVHSLQDVWQMLVLVRAYVTAIMYRCFTSARRSTDYNGVRCDINQQLCLSVGLHRSPAPPNHPPLSSALSAS